MDGEVADRVELVVARDGAGLLAVTSISKIVVRKWPAKINCLVWLKSRAIACGRLAASIDDGGNLALATNGPGGPLAGSGRAPRP